MSQSPTPPNITPLTLPSKDTATLSAILDMCPPDDQSVLVWRTHFWSILHSEQANNLPCSACLTMSFDGAVQLALYWPHMSIRMQGHYSLHDIVAFAGLPDPEQQWTRDTQEERRIVAEFQALQEQHDKEAAQRRLLQSGQAGPLASHVQRHR